MKLAPVGFVTISAKPIDEHEVWWRGTVVVDNVIAFESQRSFTDPEDAQGHMANMYRKALGRAMRNEEVTCSCEAVHSIHI